LQRFEPYIHVVFVFKIKQSRAQYLTAQNNDFFPMAKKRMFNGLANFSISLRAFAEPADDRKGYVRSTPSW
jgi:hypothetical protein